MAELAPNQQDHLHDDSLVIDKLFHRPLGDCTGALPSIANEQGEVTDAHPDPQPDVGLHQGLLLLLEVPQHLPYDQFLAEGVP